MPRPQSCALPPLNTLAVPAVQPGTLRSTVKAERTEREMTLGSWSQPWPDLSCVCPSTVVPPRKPGEGTLLNVMGINKPGATWAQTRELFQG